MNNLSGWRGGNASQLDWKTGQCTAGFIPATRGVRGAGSLLPFSERCSGRGDETLKSKADTRLRSAPYWNIDVHGRLCLGSKRVPTETSAGSLSGWEHAYFAGEFAHPSGALRLTTHPDGFVGLWASVAGRKRFPAEIPRRLDADAARLSAATTRIMSL